MHLTITQKQKRHLQQLILLGIPNHGIFIINMLSQVGEINFKMDHQTSNCNKRALNKAKI